MERVANEVYVNFGSKLSALLDSKSKHSLDDVVKGLGTLVLLLTSILSDPTDDEKRAIKPDSKSLARLFTLLDRSYVMSLLNGQPKVVCFRESIYFGLDDQTKLKKLLDLTVKYKTKADEMVKDRGELRHAWRRKKEKEVKEMESLKLKFYDDRDLRDLSFSTKHDGGAMGDLLKTLGKEKKARDALFPFPLTKSTTRKTKSTTSKTPSERSTKKHETEKPRQKRHKLSPNIPSFSDF